MCKNIYLKRKINPKVPIPNPKQHPAHSDQWDKRSLVDIARTFHGVEQREDHD